MKTKTLQEAYEYIGKEVYAIGVHRSVYYRNGTYIYGNKFYIYETKALFISFYVIKSVKDFDNVSVELLEDCYFTNKKLAKQALKLFKENYENKNRIQ